MNSPYKSMYHIQSWVLLSQVLLFSRRDKSFCIIFFCCRVDFYAVYCLTESAVLQVFQLNAESQSQLLFTCALSTLSLALEWALKPTYCFPGLIAVCGVAAVLVYMLSPTFFISPLEFPFIFCKFSNICFKINLKMYFCTLSSFPNIFSKRLFLFCYFTSTGSLNDFYKENSLKQESISYFLGAYTASSKTCKCDVPNGEVPQCWTEHRRRFEEGSGGGTAMHLMNSYFLPPQIDGT